MGKFCCCIDFLICRIQLTVTDVVTNRSGKQVCILKNDTEGMSQVVFFDLCDIDSIITDLPILDIVETVDQIGDRCFSCSGRTYECKFLTRFCIEADVVEDGFVLIVAKSYIFEPYITFELCVRYRTVCGMRMFPCPHARSLLALCDVSVGIFFRIDESYITFVILRLLIDQVKDTLCTGKCHDDGVKLLCHLHERLCKALGKLQVGSHDTKCDSPNSCNGKDPAENCCQDKLQVSDVSDDRSHHVTVFVRLCRTLKKSLVQFVKFLFGFLFMVKNFDNTLSVHTLFDKTCHICEGHLLSNEVFSTLCTDLSCDKQHQKNDQNRQDREQRAQNQHGNKGNDNRKQCHQRLRDRLADHLSQGIRIIRIKTHDRTVCILVKIADRQSLHMFKHIVSHSL